MNKLDLIKALDAAGHRESALLLKNWGEMDSTAETMAKSNSIKPDGTNIYDEKANLGRKMQRTGAEIEGAGKNVAVQGANQRMGSGTSLQSAHEANQAKVQRKKAKASLKTMSSFSPEQIKAMEDKANTKKSESLQKNLGQWTSNDISNTDFLMFKTAETRHAGKNKVVDKKKVDMNSAEGKALFSNFADSIRAGAPAQPTDQEMFGHLVTSQETLNKAEEEWNGKLNFYNDWANDKIKTTGERPEDNESWASGTSFNDTLSPEELKKRNSEVGE